MSSIFDKIIRSRCGGRVERCHTIPHHGSYNNAAHSWGVAMLMYYLFPEDYPRLSIYCLTHDIGEGWMGDVPAPALWAVDGLRQVWGDLEADLIEIAGCPSEKDLSKEDLLKLKTCDRLELYLWCKEQEALGNLFVQDCITALSNYFVKGETYHPAAADLLIAIERGKPKDFTPNQQGVVQRLVSVKQQ